MGCSGNSTSVTCFLSVLTAWLIQQIADTSEACGGRDRLSVYTSTGTVTTYPIPTVQTTDLPGNWQYSRCLAYVYFAFLSPCDLEGCSLRFREPGAVRVFPNQVIFPHNNSALNCLAQCSTFGYPAAGMEAGDECCVCSTAAELLLCHSQKHHSIGCGDVEDITNNGGTTAPETDCTTACSGDPLHLCGGGQRLQLYLWNGTLNNWQIPANIGRYEVRTKCSLLIHGRACDKAIQRSISFLALYLRCSPPSA